MSLSQAAPTHIPMLLFEGDFRFFWTCRFGGLKLETSFATMQTPKHRLHVCLYFCSSTSLRKIVARKQTALVEYECPSSCHTFLFGVLESWSAHLPNFTYVFRLEIHKAQHT
uniref:Uncharacterized protein n=1 Tax=Palpitomonas bilix TaxID=652834 RepID=A0A7S3DBM8_9EUKA